MGIKKRCCEKFVKDNIGVPHHSCDGTKNIAHALGHELNALSKSEVFEGDKRYRICANIVGRVKRKYSNVSVVVKYSDASLVIGKDRSRGRHIPEGGNNPSGDHGCDIHSPARIGHKSKWVNTVLEKAEKYRKQFSKLVLRQRQRRVHDLANEIIASCVDQDSLKAEGHSYFVRNKTLAVDCMTVIDLVKDRILYGLHISSCEIEEEVTPQREHAEKQKKDTSFASALCVLNECSVRGYNRIRKELISNLPLPDYRSLTKSRPQINGRILQEIPSGQNFYFAQELDQLSTATVDIDAVVVPDVWLKDPCSSMACDPQTNFLLTEENFENNEKAVTKNFLASIHGDYPSFVRRIISKWDSCGVRMNGNVGVIDSYDGAIHTNSDGKRLNIISFSSVAFSLDSFQHGWSTNQSCQILTWMQVIGEETLSTMISAAYEYYTHKRNIRNGYSELIDDDISFFEMHDAKMIYILTQHSQYSRKQVQYFDRSKHRWDKKKSHETLDKEYTIKTHLDWIDENNFGISHYGLPPHLLPRSSIRFDTFHCRGAITRRFLGDLRTFFRSQTFEVNKALHTFLGECWSPFCVLLFSCNKKLSCMQGKELLEFIRIIPKLVDLIDELFEKSPYLESFCGGLLVWEKISQFMHITNVKNNIEYERSLDKFDLDVKLLYKYGAISFLTAGNNIGGTETFYFHAVRYYLPVMARQTWDTFKLGLGIFSMQGFESRNKESKCVLSKYSNHKGNLVINNLARLYDVFQHGFKFIK